MKMKKTWASGPTRVHTRQQTALPTLWRRLALIVALIALVAASCGSDGDSSSVSNSAQEDSTETTSTEATSTEATSTEDESAASEAGAGEQAPEPTEEPEPEPEVEEPAPAKEPSDDEVAQLPLAAETIEWEDCDFDQCGIVEVPVDYDDPSAGTLNIAVSVHRATDLDKRVGYLLMNPGGPGGPGLGMATAGWPEELEEAFDLIGFDPRGVGASEPTFACGQGSEQFDLLNQIDGLPDTPEEVELGRQAVQLCVDSMGPAALQLGTDEVVRDMDEIRKALGAEQISYLGGSYGSTIGIWYASRFPENVQSMVIDAAGDSTLKSDTLEATIDTLAAIGLPLEAQLEAALNSCVDDSCPAWNDGDPIGYWQQAAAKFDLVVDEAGGNPSAGLTSVNGFLYTQDDWPALHNAVADLVERDDASLFIDQGFARSTLGADPTAPKFHEYVNCLDAIALHGTKTVEEAVARALDFQDDVEAWFGDNLPLLAAIETPDVLPTCDYFELLDPPGLDVAFDGGGVPILVIGNTSDQVTPFVQSEQVANEVLANGHLVKTDHFAHTVYPANTCVNDAVHAALIDQEYSTEVVECERQDPEPASWGTVELIEVELPSGATILGPDGWSEVEPGVWLRPVESAADEAVFAVQPNEGSVEAGVAAVEDQFGGTAEPNTELPGDGFTWSVFQIEPGDNGDAGVAFFAVTDEADGIIVFGLTSEDQIDAMIGTVLQPALLSYKPAGG